MGPRSDNRGYASDALQLSSECGSGFNGSTVAITVVMGGIADDSERVHRVASMGPRSR